MTALLAPLVALLALAAPVENARVTTRSAAGGLAPELQTLLARKDAVWAGWSVPVVAGVTACCGDWRGDCRCRLEEDHGFNLRTGEDGVRPAASRLNVLVRVAAGRVDRVRAFGETCALDGDGAALTWLEDAAPAESVAWLLEQARAAGAGRRVADGAIAAIALHADPAADAALARLAEPGVERSLREKAVFWAGTARGSAGYRLLERATHDGDARFREHVTFALSQSPEPAALDTLIGMAHADQEPRVRSKALFWLAQKAGKKAVAEIERATRDDPDADVKLQAVFALSQLPREEGVPLLIRAARSQASPEVRKRAMFWLGQSEDPRALAFFEEVLTR